jgi:hypothetical protein
MFTAVVAAVAFTVTTVILAVLAGDLARGHTVALGRIIAWNRVAWLAGTWFVCGWYLFG